MRHTLLSAVALLVLAAPTVAQQTANPYDSDPAAMRAGRALFANRCAECHGADARGFSGPDLTVLWAEGTSDERVFQTIRSGVSGSIMPSSTAPDNEIWAMVAYVKSISTVAAALDAPGDPERGQELVQARCTRCHYVAGGGGYLGPDLSRIGAVRTRESLMRSIREPAASIQPGYRTVTLVTPSGDRIRGVAKGEDAFSVQILDTRQQLRGYMKSDLAEVVREPVSLMPEFTSARLPDEDLNDIVRYLGTLRGNR
ncbi:MAG: c-type cytochrome [Gemmatimonadota bacterium]|nr:c-type cytochrome [Gemmatimonadota bacterium]